MLLFLHHHTYGGGDECQVTCTMSTMLRLHAEHFIKLNIKKSSTPHKEYIFIKLGIREELTGCSSSDFVYRFVDIKFHKYAKS